ncbi:MAG: protein kinase [Sandaracinaceae bacterium]|nr:protein kinase [Sandaracinaceae bacterium]
MLRRIARGGMAEVYAATFHGVGGFEKPVAVKVIHPRFSGDEHFVQLLVEEAKIAVLLDHVNIVQTYDLGCVDGTYFIAMELIEGGDLHRLGRAALGGKGGIPVEIAAFIGGEVCKGLDYAHRKRDPKTGEHLAIIHRDISPQNILVSYGGAVKITDFGIAKAALRATQTEVGVIKGKFCYMSPEQAWGDPVDHRSDVFSVGVVLYELLAGRPLYQESDLHRLIAQVRAADVPPLGRANPQVPSPLAEIVMRALNKEPSQRWQSAGEMAEALHEFLYRLAPRFSVSQVADWVQRLIPPQPQQGRHEQKKAVRDIPKVMMQRKGDDATQVTRPPQEFIPAPTVPDVLASSSHASSSNAPSSSDVAKRTPPAGRHQVERVNVRVVGKLSNSASRATTPAPIQSINHAEPTKATTSLPDVDDDPTIVGERPSVAGAGVIGYGRNLLSSNSPPSDTQKDNLVAKSSTIPPPGVGKKRSRVTPISERGSDRAERTTWRPPALPKIPHQEVVKEQSSLLPQNNAAPLQVIDSSQKQTPAQENIPFADQRDGKGAWHGANSLLLPASGAYSLSTRHFSWWWVALFVLALSGTGGFMAYSLMDTPPPGFVIDSIPRGAMVYMDDAQKGTTPVQITNQLVIGKTYSFEVRKEGYEKVRFELKATQGTHRREVLLIPQRAHLRIETSPPDAQVWVGGTLRGKAPIVIDDLLFGSEVEVRVEAVGYQPASRRIRMIHNEQREQIQLTPILQPTPTLKSRR